MPEIHGRYIVTAHNADGGAYRYVAVTKEDAQRQAAIFASMGLMDARYRRVLMDARGNVV